MSEPRIVALAREADAAVPETCDRVALGELAKLVAHARSYFDALDARIARRAEELAALGQSEPEEAVVAAGGRRRAASVTGAIDRSLHRRRERSTMAPP